MKLPLPNRKINVIIYKFEFPSKNNIYTHTTISHTKEYKIVALNAFKLTIESFMTDHVAIDYYTNKLAINLHL